MRRGQPNDIRVCLLSYLPCPLFLATLALAGALDYSRPALLAGAVGVVMAASLLGQVNYRLFRGVGHGASAAALARIGLYVWLG